jgi:hypothetical protein
MFPGFDGLMTLSRREGVDVRPTLLRVLTDLYVQAAAHTVDEEQQFIELASRLIDEVDDATRAAVRARLAIYPHTPEVIKAKLAVSRQTLRATPQHSAFKAADAAPPLQPLTFQTPSMSRETIARPAPAPLTGPPSESELRASSSGLSAQPAAAAEVTSMFFAANTDERKQILLNLATTPLRPSARILESRAERAIETLEAAAFAADQRLFISQLSSTLMLPRAITEEIVCDPGREPLACALKALGMPSAVFQRVLMFLDPEFGQSVDNVYRLARFYDVLDERSALIMLSAWRGASFMPSRAKYKPVLYDDDRSRIRGTQPMARPAVQPGSAFTAPSKQSTGS